jgi:hypothetical protein
VSSHTSAPAVRPVDIDELKHAWRAVEAGEFRTRSAAAGRRDRAATSTAPWTSAAGERTIAMIGCAGSCGTSTVALAAGLAAADPVRVVECCSVTASGLGAASTAELGLHPTGWRQGKRDHVLLERTSDVLSDPAAVPVPTDADHDNQLTILDVGWEAGQLLTTSCWLADAVRSADRLVLVTSATVPGMRRLGGVLDLLTGHWLPEQVTVAVLGPRRKKWPRGAEPSGGPAVRRALAGTGLVEIPTDRGLAVTGLDSRPVPTALISAARRLLDPASRAEVDT